MCGSAEVEPDLAHVEGMDGMLALLHLDSKHRILQGVVRVANAGV